MPVLQIELLEDAHGLPASTHALQEGTTFSISICNAGPDGNPFYSIAWLPREEARQSTPKSFSPIPNLVYFPDLQDALKSHLHAKHRLGYADRKTGYNGYYL
eukprot:1136186-Pelagomonas_calceolata.AAC.2